MKKLKVYLSTCNNYLFLVKPFTFLWNKFWQRSQEVVYLGYDKPEHSLQENFDFISVGPDDGLENWAKDLIKFFNSIDDEYFIFTYDDGLLVDQTNFGVYDKLLKYLDNPKVGRICLTRDTTSRPHRLFDKSDGLTVIEANAESDYRISFSPSIWRKEYFLKYLEKGMNHWTFESVGSERAKNDGYHILGVKGDDGPPDNAVMFNTNAMWRVSRNSKKRFNFHNSNYSYVNSGQNYLDPLVVKEMYDKNIIDRDIESGWVYDKKWYPYKEI
jgi:hypothetical protein